MASADKLKREIDLHDLAERLEMERPDPNGNYRAPGRADKHPSVSIFFGQEAGHMMWKDHTSGEKGSCIDLVIYCGRADDASEAMKWLHEEFGIPTDSLDQPQQNKSQLEWLAEKQLAVANDARAYLFDERKIPAPVIDMLQKRGAFGFSDWTNPKKNPGEMGHGGPAISFPARCVLSKQVMGIDYRYFDPVLNGDLKTKAQGEKRGYPYIPDSVALKRAKTVIVVESPINAISAIAAFDPLGANKGTTTAIATRGLAVEDIDWRFLAGKKVVCCFDNDLPIKEGPRKGHRPGPEAAWLVHEACTALNIPCFFVDQEKTNWEGVNDLNDYLRKHGTEETKLALLRLEQWLVFGQSGDFKVGRFQRVSLPSHDANVYSLFRTKQDFTSYIKVSQSDEGEEQITPQDLCGFRVASFSRITIASPRAVMSGDQDQSSKTLFSASVQSPRHQNTLIRKVFEDEQVHNLDQWRKFGAIYRPAQFSRMINILERTAHIGERHVANFVGLAWLNGKPVFNEGPDCYFTNPKQQCPYHNLRFISGTPGDGKKVIEAYSKTFQQSSALILLVWSVGCHIKNFLGYWPHFTLQADKGAGKSTLIKRLERTIGFTMLSSESMTSMFRLLTSVGHTSHPIGWEEISTQDLKIINKAVSLLQESYQYTDTKRTTDMTEFIISAPVLLAGEDVPVQSLQGKLVRSDLTNRKGELLPDDLPRFPVKEWIQFLTTFSRDQIKESFRECNEFLQSKRSSVNSDSAAERMIENYTCVLLAWKLLCEFTGLPSKYGKFVSHLVTEMNTHVSETNATREPWVWILHVILGEIDSGQFRYPYVFDWIDGELCLLIRTSHMMQQLSQTPALKQTFDSLPVKSDRVLKRQLKNAGVILKEPCEKTINTRRVSNLIALGVENLREFGLYPAIPENIQEQHVNTK